MNHWTPSSQDREIDIFSGRLEKKHPDYRIHAYPMTNEMDICLIDKESLRFIHTGNIKLPTTAEEWQELEKKVDSLISCAQENGLL